MQRVTGGGQREGAVPTCEAISRVIRAKRVYQAIRLSYAPLSSRGTRSRSRNRSLPAIGLPLSLLQCEGEGHPCSLVRHCQRPVGDAVRSLQSVVASPGLPETCRWATCRETRRRPRSHSERIPFPTRRGRRDGSGAPGSQDATPTIRIPPTSTCPSGHLPSCPCPSDPR